MKPRRGFGWSYEARNAMDDYTFYELPFYGEAPARRVFEAARQHSKVNGGSGRLIHNGKTVARFSHFAENE